MLPECGFCGHALFRDKCSNRRCGRNHIKVCDIMNCDLLKSIVKTPRLTGPEKAIIKLAQMIAQDVHHFGLFESNAMVGIKVRAYIPNLMKVIADLREERKDDGKEKDGQ